MNYARRQQYRRLSHAGEAGIGATVTALLGLWAASVGAARVAVCLLIVAPALGLCARHWLSLARRSRVGLRSEDAVQRALAPLQAEGWGLRHSLPCEGRGDIESVAIAPSGDRHRDRNTTRSYDSRHLARVHEQMAWLSRRRRRWACSGALGVLCLVRARDLERVEDDVVVVSIDRLTHVLRVAARMGSRRPFKRLTADPGERCSAALYPGGRDDHRLPELRRAQSRRPDRQRSPALPAVQGHSALGRRG